ncbi:hypothetical protein HDV05_006770, partial [Chytridiales sp. JEL 0842]
MARYSTYPRSPTTKTILLNPGGPGGSGKDLVLFSGQKFHSILGGKLDIIGFDPRGVGESNPVLCFPSQTSHSSFDSLLAERGIPGIPGSAISPQLYAAYIQAGVQSCSLKNADFLKYVTTTSTARDMDLIREILGMEEMYYYGVSYGTFLGNVYMNMFPDKVGRMIIDSVLDPVVYTGSSAALMNVSVMHGDEIMAKFGSLCEEAGPERCALAQEGKQGRYVLTKILQLLDSIAENPVPVY